MSAVTTKPKAKASRAKPAKRANAVYVPSTETTLRARLDTLQAALTQAEEHIERAYDAAEDGSAVEVLLDHLSHVLLADAMRPMMGTSPNRDNAQHTYSELFLVTAALNGAMAMVTDMSIRPMLQEAFELLDWSQNESNSQALIDLLPEADLAAEFARGRDFAIKMMADVEELQDEREGLRRYRRGGAQDNIVRAFFADVEDDRTLVHGFTSVLSAALRNDNMDLSELAKITLAEVQSGRPGAHGTEVDDTPSPASSAPHTPGLHALDRMDLSNQAVALNDLISWIIDARDTLESIRVRVMFDSALETKLLDAEIPFRSPEWASDCPGAGFAHLLMHQRSLLQALGRGAS